jgi:tripartite-type tricarboxylate transporter receptor subunit TctC
VHLIVPFASGGSTDMLGHAIAQEIARWKPVIEQSHMQPD